MLYAATAFLAAALLFMVQPMVARQVLPLLGGSPAVWNTSLVFFQAALLAGYVYAHWMGRHRPRQHLWLLALPVLVLPIGLPAGWMPPTEHNPIPWLLKALAVMVGLPFVVVATTSPLLQRWFAATGRDPYFLYAASNAGSLVGLLSYPTLVEPTLRLQQQSQLWAAGYLTLAVLVAGCAVVGRSYEAANGNADSRGRPTLISWRRRLRWVLLAFAPSSLMLSVTTYLSTDIAAVPLLWVVPLSVYLLTFILVFVRRQVLSHRWMIRALPVCVLPLVGVLAKEPLQPIALIGGWHLLTLFVAAMVCHGELANDRPEPQHLTEFYLWLSLGGALGGMFNALVAPLMFSSVAEYPVTLALVCLLKPTMKRWPWLGLGLGLLLLVSANRSWKRFNMEHVERSFFGVSRVARDRPNETRRYFHGTTLHGLQCLDPARRREPLGYYDRRGPIGQLFEVLPAATNVAVTGLGAGGLLAYAEAGQHWTMYEIDPAVERIAQNTNYFTYLSDCPAAERIVMGDARLSLAGADEQYDVMILDAYNSDALPVHLITREALAVYLARLAPRGVLAFHISNRYLDLTSVVSRLAADVKLFCLVQDEQRLNIAWLGGYRHLSNWAVMTRQQEVLQGLERDSRWSRPSPRTDTRIWTDDYSSVFSVFKWRFTTSP